MKFKTGGLNHSKPANNEPKKTFLLGLLVTVIIVILVFFGFSLLIKFSSFLGNTRHYQDENKTDGGLPPLPPRLYVPFEATNSAVVNISGTAELETVIEISQDEVLLDTIDVSDQGQFEFENVVLKPGLNNFSAVAISSNGKRSDVSKETAIVFDDILPKLEMKNPVEDKLTVDYEDFDLVGIVESGVSVTVNGRIASVDSEGNFKIKMELNPGENIMEVIVKDLAGNQTNKKISITYDF